MKNDFLIELLEKPGTYHTFWLTLTLFENKPVSNSTLYNKSGVSRTYGEFIFKWIISALERHNIPYVLTKYSQKSFVISFNASAPKVSKVIKGQQTLDFGQNIKEDPKNGAKIDRVLRYLNSLSGKDYGISVKRNRYLLNELCYKYTEDELRMVIDYKCAEWMGTPQEKWLRPSTLFGPKFDEYRVEASSAQRLKNSTDINSNDNGKTRQTSKDESSNQKIRRELATGLDAASKVFRTDTKSDGEEDVSGSFQEQKDS